MNTRQKLKHSFKLPAQGWEGSFMSEKYEMYSQRNSLDSINPLTHIVNIKK